jgi:isopropylmalate/homocitrate/citramalate synthase
MLPARFGQFIRDAFAHVPLLSKVLLGVQCADGLSLAAAAALSAVEAGRGTGQNCTAEMVVLPLETIAGDSARARG